jgi:hypothetical protein
MLTPFSPNTFANDDSSSNKMFMTAPCIFFFWLIDVNVKPPKARIAVLILTSGDTCARRVAALEFHGIVRGHVVFLVPTFFIVCRIILKLV